MFRRDEEQIKWVIEGIRHTERKRVVSKKWEICLERIA